MAQQVDQATAADRKHFESSRHRDAGEEFARAVAIMAKLRGPDGCPWDREQTPATIRKHTLEETYEVLDAIERGNSADLCEELGDLLLQVLFYAQMAAEDGSFTMTDVVTGLNRKLIRRHPHVFGDRAETVENAAGVLRTWNRVKAEERQSKPSGLDPAGRLDHVLRAQPALLEAGKLGSTAAKVGFDWTTPADLLAKVHEEIAEVEAELAPGHPPSVALHEELGDLLFVTANLARHLAVEPETALRDANAKFRRRFAAMEAAERADGGPPLGDRSLEALEALWTAAKRAEGTHE